MTTYPTPEALRVMRGLDNEQFAEAVGLGIHQWWRVRRGDAPLSRKVIDAICDRFGVAYVTLPGGGGYLREVSPEELERVNPKL